jgi:toxin secretion/phage lysis holin
VGLLSNIQPDEIVSIMRELIPVESAPEDPSQWWDGIVTLYTTLWSSYPLVAGLLTLMLLDIITGTFKAMVLKEVSSNISMRGMYKKVMMLATVAVAWLFEMFFPKISGQTIPWGQITAGFFWLVEGWSILENATKAGVPLPKALVDMVAKKKAADESTNPMVQLNVNTTNNNSDGTRTDTSTKSDSKVTVVVTPPPVDLSHTEKIIESSKEETKSAIRKAHHDTVDQLSGKILSKEADEAEQRAKDRVLKRQEEMRGQ